MGEEWYVARSGFIGVCCAEIGERGAEIGGNKQTTYKSGHRADLTENNNN